MNINKNIALVGHMGSGKTLLAKLIAKKYKLHHYDSDKLIENKTNMKIKEIFEIHGESYFRNIEQDIILNLKNHENLIVSLGGGSILNSKIRKFIKLNFTSFFLDVSFETLTKRLKKSNKRPLLFNQNIEEKIKELDKIRRKYYLLSDIVLSEYSTKEKLLNVFDLEYKKIK